MSNLTFSEARHGVIVALQQLPKDRRPSILRDAGNSEADLQRILEDVTPEHIKVSGKRQKFQHSVLIRALSELNSGKLRS